MAFIKSTHKLTVAEYLEANVIQNRDLMNVDECITIVLKLKTADLLKAFNIFNNIKI